MCVKTSNDIINNEKMCDDEIVASGVPPRYLLFFTNIKAKIVMRSRPLMCRECTGYDQDMCYLLNLFSMVDKSPPIHPPVSRPMELQLELALAMGISIKHNYLGEEHIICLNSV